MTKREFEEYLTLGILNEMDKDCYKLNVKTLWNKNFSYNVGFNRPTDEKGIYNSIASGYYFLPIRMVIIEELLNNNIESDYLIAKGIIKEQRRNNKLILLYHDIRTNLFFLPKKYIK